MSITSYSELVDAIVDRMEDSGLSTYAPEFIQMAEAMFNRRLNTLDMEVTATTAAANSIALPSGFKGFRSIKVDDYSPLGQLSPDDFQAKYAEDTSTGVPVDYALYDGAIYLGPLPDSAYTVTMTYLATLTGLSASNTSNWLLASHPDLYLYASLIHAEFRGWNDDRIPLLNNAVEGILAEINAADARKRRAGLVATVETEYF